MNIPPKQRQSLQNQTGAYGPTVRFTNDAECPLVLVQYSNFDPNGIPHSTQTIFLSPQVIQAVSQAAGVALQGWNGGQTNGQQQQQQNQNQNRNLVAS
jgi:hypothetical protein